MECEIDKNFVNAQNQFAVEIYQLAAAEKSENVIVSPASVQSALTLAMFGAAGETKKEIFEGLKYPSELNNEAIAENYRKFGEKIRNSNCLKVANKIYVMQGHAVKNSFQSIAVKSFNSEAEYMDFGENTSSAKKINDWVEYQTNNKIKDLIDPSSLNSRTRMIIVNALYFKGCWEQKFDPKATKDGPFFINDLDSVDVKFMRLSETYLGYNNDEELDAQIVELPFQDTDMVMLIILPNLREGLADLEKKLKNVNLMEINESMNRNKKVNLELPKFKIEFSIELTEELRKMGMNQMFDEADFSNLFEERLPTNVSRVFHKVFIDVNEEGAEAAAAMDFRALFMCRKFPVEFIADHPFMFVLKDTTSIHFIGKVSNFPEN